MKTLKIYKENDEFVIENINEMNKARKRYFLDEEDLKQALVAYSYVIDNYRVETSKDVREIVNRHLRKRKT